MESGFGQNLEGFLIKGNLSLLQGDIPALQGDGSIEGSGTLYINNIREYDVLNGINIQDVLLQNHQIIVPYTQPSLGPTVASFIIDGGIFIKTTTNATSITSGGGLTIAGGASIAKNVNVGGILDVNNNRITSVALPLIGTDVANKNYVDSKTFGNILGNFTAGQVIVGGTAGTIIGYESLKFDGNLLTVNTPVVINNTTNAQNLTTASFITLGGMSIGENVIIGGGLNMSGESIENVGTPINPNDVATKAYVDNQTGVDGNFTTGQLIIAASNGDSIRGYDNVRYYDIDGTKGNVVLSSETNLVLSNTNNAIGLGSGGGLKISGGASIDKDLYVGGIIDVAMNNIKSVADPIEDYDAVNKAYLDNTFNDENFVMLYNNVTVPMDIPDFGVTQNERAFLTYVYVQYNQENCATFLLRGINRGTDWYLQKTFVGSPPNVDFFIRYDNGNGILQYTNTNLVGNASIRYVTFAKIFDVANDNQINVDIDNNVSSFESIPELTFLNSEYDAVKLVIYVSNDSEGEYGMVFLNCLLKGTEWIMTPHSFGNIPGINDLLLPGINFGIETSLTNGTIQYTNTNSIGQYTLRVYLLPILKSQSSLSLVENTNTFTDISFTELIFDNSQFSFQMRAFVTIPDMNKHALYDFDGVHCDGVWSLNARYIGDTTLIRFEMETFGSYGTLRYINPNSDTAYIRYVLDTPVLYEALPVKRGGTGLTYLTPHAVLRGNGIDPILASNDFVYKDLQLKLGANSSMLMTNTADSSFTSYGGAVIGGPLRVKGVDIIPSVGDFFTEQVFFAANDVSQQNVVGFSLTHPNIKSFNGTSCITIKTDIDEYNALFDIKALRKVNGWVIQTSYFGDDTGITFGITTSGQIQYNSPDINNWVETKIKYRGLTTTV